MADIKQQEQQFKEAYDAYSDAVFRYCYYRVFDRKKAERLVAKTYCRVWKQIARGSDAQDLLTDIYRTAHTAVHGYMGRNIFSLAGFKDTVLRHKNMMGENGAAADMGDDELIIRGIRLLDEKYRDVVVLKYINRLAIRQISLIVGEPEDVVNTKAGYGHLKIKEMLKNKKYGFVSAFNHGV